MHVFHLIKFKDRNRMQRNLVHLDTLKFSNKIFEHFEEFSVNFLKIQIRPLLKNLSRFRGKIVNLTLMTDKQSYSLLLLSGFQNNVSCEW